MKKAVFLILLPIVAEAAVNQAYLTAHVVDAVDRLPLGGAKITARFEDDIGWRAWTEEPSPDIVHGWSNSNGICRLNGQTNCGKSSCWIEEAPKGYYKPLYGGGNIQYERRSLLGAWQPDDVTITFSLNRIEHPIPLYVNRTILDGGHNSIGGFDGTNAVLRFDFMAGDWLPPEGDGKYADMIIHTNYVLREEVKDGKYYTQVFYDFVNRIEFPGVGNGLVEYSVANRNPGIRIRSAPESGYVACKTLCFGRRRKKTEVKGVWPDLYTESNDDRCYAFRIRSQFDENGNLIGAYYGKVYGDFRFRGDDQAGLHGVNFLYYLNPVSLDRNLEWDMETNICAAPLRLDYESIGVRYREP